MKSNVAPEQQASDRTTAPALQRSEPTNPEARRLVGNSDNGDSVAAPASSNGLFVIPRGRGGGFQATIRGHILDLADPSSGHALAPTPDDLFIASIAADCAWSAQRFLRACALPDDVSVSATWQMHGGPLRPADISLTVTLPERAEGSSAALVTELENRFAARTAAASALNISLRGVNR